MWCIAELNEEFVERMEDLLNLYEKPLNPDEPVLCLDEKPVQCRNDKRRPVRVKNGVVRRDYEYVRRGTANVFCVVEPKAAKHLTQATENRKKPAFAYMVREIARKYPSASTIHLVMDNLNTHTKSSLTETFGDEEGAKLWSRFTVHYTPKHGSWLNQAEIAIGIFTRQCLGNRRMGSLEALVDETNAWRREANAKRIKIDWSFTVTEARRKFRYSKLRGKIMLSRN